MGNGVATSNITSASTITEIIGNQRVDADHVQTVRVPIDAVANQMLGDGPIAEEIAAVRSETVTEFSAVRSEVAAADEALEAKITANNLGATQASAAEAIAGTNATHWMSPAQDKAALDDRVGNLRAANLPDESGWPFALEDAGHRIAIAVDSAGKLWARLRDDAQVPETALPAATVAKLLQGGLTSSSVNAESGWTFVVPDASGRVGYGLKLDGTFWAKFADDSVFPTSLQSALSSTILASIFPDSAIVGYGDSLTNGAGGGGTTYLTVLGAALGRSTMNRGVGGQASAAIATRQGGLPMVVSVSGDTIPASGSVALTARSQTPITNSGPTSYTGVLAGVAGTLAASTSDGGATYDYTFTRSTSGGTQTTLSPTFADGGGGSGHTAGTGVERTTKGGLHVAARQDALTGGEGRRVLWPTLLMTYFAANPTHAFYASLWRQITRAGVAPFTVEPPMLGAYTAATPLSNSIFLMSALADSKHDLGYRNSNPNTLGASLRNVGVSAAYGSPTTVSTDMIGWGATPSAWSSIIAGHPDDALSWALYRVYVEDLTVSGRTYATVDAIDYALFQTAFASGGKYYGDTWTAPATLAGA